MLYFAYGSNMSIRRLRAGDRAPSADRVTVARLPEYRLVFHKKSADGSAKCDAYYTGRRGDFIIGVLYELNESEKRSLDIIEGLGRGYDEKEVTVITDSGPKSAVAYFATNIDTGLKPYDWYKVHVVVGAQENDLPANYLDMIEEVESVADPDRQREERELSIYS